MKTIRVLCCCLLIFGIIVMSGCHKRKVSYTYEQSFDNIKKVELCIYDYETESANPIMEFDLETAKMLLEEFSTIACSETFGDSIDDCGYVIVYITYANGDAEAIGMVMCAQINSSGKWIYKTTYFDNDAKWCITLLKYVDPQIIPEVLSYLNRNV